MKFNKFLDDLSNYEAGKPIELVVREFGVKKKDVLKLASNENPFGSSKKAQKAIKKCATCAHLYPDDSMFELKDALATKFGVKSENIIIGAGSDQIIEFALHSVLSKGFAILQAGVSFAMYGIYARHCEGKIYKTKEISHDLEALKSLYEAHKNEIKAIFLCMPNNPLGECLDAEKIYEFIASVDKDTLVIIDAAYNEFATFKDKNKHLDPKFIATHFTNALYLGTFSKAYGLGGMRVGYGIGESGIISALYKLRPPFNITTPTLAAAIAALGDDKFVQKTLQNNFQQMKKFEKFATKNGIKFLPSYANFITFMLGENQSSTQICDALLRQGIILRNLKSYGLNAIRITIGLPKQNSRVFKALKELL
ncbi:MULTISPECIES: histidinol-phosphate transaminase [unclassified Campylobacter]|uniref:histidinol-phosphate transaminase n=1 Tax=unclassified Campylobacter TaxID=2593542 RepID=UPI0022EA0990|nr:MULTISPECIES: histidinol-phosphate transaminase [unclassified Campylobacter]MDA3062104.1 histidinol-phosphate transaminase [Campylobacter sp. JMF_14 EL1]MDA3072792.1 histidinol-phosphate transaminase [Campylobacter sp. JMF_10 EL2]